jgi:(p)ppGpp synthase/HD superfamily hydrolase
MDDTLESTYRPLLEAVSLAARAHRHQLRKDQQTPYVSHVYRVGLVLREVFGITDRQALLAAVLHDTLEDTTTDFDDLQERFGPEVARWVALLSKDKRLPDPEREAAYCRQIASAPWQVQVCKLADIFDNLMDSIHMGPEQRRKVLHRARTYLAALEPALAEQARRPWQLVSGLVAERETRDGA